MHRNVILTALLLVSVGFTPGCNNSSLGKTNACDWPNDLISDYEFLDGIYWLIDNGKIQLD